MLPPRLVDITGKIGRWVSLVEGQWLATLHNTYWSKPHDYFAPIDSAHIPGGKRYDEFIDALRTYPRIVMQKDADPRTLLRAGYIGVFFFEFEKLTIDSTGIRLRITKRDASPRNRR